MGFHMAGHLSAKGYEVYVYNRTKAKSIKWLKTFKGRALDSLNKLDVNFDGVININDVLSLVNQIFVQ